MAVVYFPFTPNVNSPFQFQPVLDGTTYSAVVTWNLFAQRYYVSLYALDGTLMFSLPVVGSQNWISVQLTTTKRSQTASFSYIGSLGTTFLTTQTNEYVVAHNNSAYIVTQQLGVSPFSIASGTQIISSLVPDGTYIDVVAGRFISMSAVALATDVDVGALFSNDINIAKGYFSQQSLVYRQSAARFEIHDLPTPTVFPGKSSFTSEGFAPSLVSPFPVSPPSPPPIIPPLPVVFADGVVCGTGPNGAILGSNIPFGALGLVVNQLAANGNSDNGLTTTGPALIVGFAAMMQTRQVGGAGLDNPEVTSVHSPNLTFIRRGFALNGMDASLFPPAQARIEIWAAISHGPLTNEMVIATFNGNVMNALFGVIAFYDADLIKPWDLTPSLPRIAANHSQNVSALNQVREVTTSLTNNVLLAITASGSPSVYNSSSSGNPYVERVVKSSDPPNADFLFSMQVSLVAANTALFRELAPFGGKTFPSGKDVTSFYNNDVFGDFGATSWLTLVDAIHLYHQSPLNSPPSSPLAGSVNWQ